MTAAFPISAAWVAVWRRNYLVWKKLAAESGNIIEPLLYLVPFVVQDPGVDLPWGLRGEKL